MIVELFLLLSGIPIGILGAYLTNYERNIYKNYFPPILWILAITSAIFYSIDINIALTTTFMFIMILTWSCATKYFKLRK